MKDFIHGALVKAASTDGIETMLKGAGIGAGANVGLGAVQGDFDVIGNAFSGAALGGVGGAAFKYGANRYGANLMKQAATGESKAINMFTKAEEGKGLSFMGGNDIDKEFAERAGKGEFNNMGWGTAKGAEKQGPKAVASTPNGTTTTTPKTSDNTVTGQPKSGGLSLVEEEPNEVIKREQPKSTSLHEYAKKQKAKNNIVDFEPSERSLFELQNREQHYNSSNVVEYSNIDAKSKKIEYLITDFENSSKKTSKRGKKKQ